MRIALLLLPCLLAACGGARVRSAFDTRLEEVLAPPKPLPSSWSPDASVILSSDVVAEALGAALQAAPLQAEVSLAGLSARPSLSVRDIAIDLPSAPCDGCIGASARLEGTLGLQALGATAAAVLTAELSVDLSLSARAEDGVHELRLRPERVVEVAVRLGGRAPAPLQRLSLTPLERWLSGAVLDAVPDVRVARFGLEGLPVLGLRVVPIAGGVRLDAATEAPPLAFPLPAPPPPRAGWSGRVSTASALALARRALFRAGPVTHGVWPDPAGLVVEGGRFALDLRLWRPRPGWWLDLDISGVVRFERGRFVLVAEEVVERAASRGARAVDPLAALLQGRILEGVADALTTALPMRAQEHLGHARATWTVADVTTEGDTLAVQGEARFVRSEGRRSPEDR